MRTAKRLEDVEPAKLDLLITWVENGMPLDEAADLTGFDASAVEDWCARGESYERALAVGGTLDTSAEPFLRFVDRIREAVLVAHECAWNTVVSAAESGDRGARAWLRQHPELEPTKRQSKP